MQSFQQRSFIRHGRHCTIEADGWPDEVSADAAILALHIWAIQFGWEETAALHNALASESAALV